MKINKRALTVILSVIMVIAAIVPASAETDNVIIVDESGLMEAFAVVSGLGLMPGLMQTTAYFESAMNRGDFAQILAILSGLEKGYSENGYRDVTAGMKNYGAICLAVEMGYMTGSNGLFRPDDAITLGDALRGLVMVSGNHLKNSANTSLSYQLLASNAGIGKGVSGDISAPVSNGAVLKLIFQTLDAPYYEDVGRSATDVRIEKYSSFMEGKLKVSKVRGVVTASTYTSISERNGAGELKLTIGETTYKTDKNWDTYLGCSVSAYIKDDDGDEILKALVPASDNFVWELKPSDISDFRNKNEINIYTDELHKRTKKLRLNNGTSIIKNGVFDGTIVDFTLDELKLWDNIRDVEKSGSVKLIDNNGDGILDVYFMWVYDTYQISIADTEKKQYVDNQSRAVLDLSGYSEDRIVVYDDGNAADIANLSKGKLINVAESDDKSLVTIMISSASLENAEISQIRLSDEREYVIGGSTYVTSDYFERFYQNDARFRIAPGEVYTFLVDAFGKIAAIKEGGDTNFMYGYLTLVKIGSGLSKSCRMKIFSEIDGVVGFTTYEPTERIRINDKIYNRSDLQKCPEIFPDGVFRDQFIKYSVNERGEINKLLTAGTENALSSVNFSYEDNWYSEERFSLNFDGTLNYKGGADLLGNKYRPGSNTLWIIPDDLSDEKGFMISTVSSHFVNDSVSYNVKIYDVDKNLAPGAVVWRSSSAGATFRTNSTFIISKITHALNDEGEPVYVFRGYTLTEPSGVLNSSEMTLTAEDDEMLDGYKVGDIIQLNKNPYGIVKEIKKVHKDSGNPDYYTTEAVTDYSGGGNPHNPGRSGGMTYGKLVLGSQTTVGITLNDGQTFTVYGKYASLPYVIVDREEKKVKVDANPALYGFEYGKENSEDVFVIGTYFRALMIVIYK